MSRLPRDARAFVLLILGMAAAAVGFVAWQRPFFEEINWWELFLLCGLGVVLGGKKVRLMPTEDLAETGSMSLGFALTFAAILRAGPAGGMLVGLCTSLASSLFPNRLKGVQITFNTSLAVVEAFLGGFLFLIASGWTLAPPVVLMLPAVLLATSLIFLTNTFAVATILALVTKRSAWLIWRDEFVWTAPSFYAGSTISALAIVLLGNQIGTLLAFASPVLYLTYSTYALYQKRAQEKAEHIEQLEKKQDQLAELYLATIKSLALAIDAKDQHTHEHILRVQRYAVATAERLGMVNGELEAVRTGALLHDIGKLGVPDYVLLKPGRLTEEEYAKIKKHPEIGASILDPVQFPWPVVPVVKHHHEKWDGTGYPDGLAGEDIPLSARIMAVADVYDALTSSRSYRNAWTHEQAVRHIMKSVGSHFDPKVVTAFVDVIDRVKFELACEGVSPSNANTLVPSEVPTSKAVQAARDISKASSELWALYEVAQSLSCSLSLTEIVEILARKLEAVFPGASCLFLLCESHYEEPKVKAAVGPNRDFFLGATASNERGATTRVCRDLQGSIGPYDKEDLAVVANPSGEWQALESAIIVPILHQRRVLGTINVYHTQPSAFNSDDFQLLEAIAERAALAIYNGLLFERTKGEALTDTITGLANVRFMTAHLEKWLKAAANEENPRLALLCMDLDSFKAINDNFGHQVGDRVLRELGQIMRASLGPNDVLSRYAGDEFLVAIHDSTPGRVEEIVANLHRVVEEYDPRVTHKRLGSPRLGVSVGVAWYPAEGTDLTSLLSAADRAMYTNKSERRLARMAA